MCRTFPKHLKNFKKGQKALPFLREIKKEDEIVRVLGVYAKHVRKKDGEKYKRTSLIRMVWPGLRVIVVELLKQSTEFWDERVKPALFIEGLNIFAPLFKSAKLRFL